MPKYQQKTIPNGRAGTRYTLRLMSDITRRYKSDPTIRELALSILQAVPAKAWKMEISALLRWVQRNIRYTMDIRGVETIQTPPNTLRLKAGDCDDMSMLLASLLESVNHPTRFVAIGMRKGALCHVLVETRVGGKWIPLEATENWPAGAGPNGVRDRMIQHN